MKIDERIKGIKVWVPDKAISRQVQEKIFELGGEWEDGKDIFGLDVSFFYVNREGRLTHSGDNKVIFDNHNNKEVYYQDLLEWEPQKEEKQLDYSKWIRRKGLIFAIKGENHLLIFKDGSFQYDRSPNLVYYETPRYEIISAEELKKGDVCILDNVKYEDTLLDDFLVFMGKEDDGDYCFNYLENCFGLEKINIVHYCQKYEKFKRFLRE